MSVLLVSGYEVNGTAFAAPLVSALIAIMLQVFPQLRDKLYESNPRNSGHLLATECDQGRLNRFKF